VSGYLLDTNVISELTRPVPATTVTAWLESVDESLLFLSVLTLGEIRKGISILDAGDRRARLEAWLQRDLPARFSGRLLPIDALIGDRWGALAGDAQRRGTPIPVIDGLLIATSLRHGLTIVTRNVKDFAGHLVDSLNPWTWSGSTRS
jgi:predicted nucleic acid-binding protein